MKKALSKLKMRANMDEAITLLLFLKTNQVNLHLTMKILTAIWLMRF